MRLGIDFGGTNIKFGIFSEEGKTEVFEKKRLSLFTANGSVLNNITDYAASFAGGVKLSRGGFCIKGLIIPETGIMDSDVGAGELFRGINMRDAFSEKLGIPFWVDNDARAYTWGEWRFGAGRGSTDMVCVTLGTGIGTARIVNQRLYFGDNVLESLLGGHISIDRNGPLCPCGNRGCLEYYCSATGLAAQIKEACPGFNGQGDVITSFFTMIEDENPECRKVFETFLDNLTVGLLNLIHAYQPELIVLGGGLIKSGRFFVEELERRVQQRAWTYPRGRVRIRTAERPDQAAALGIAFYPGKGESREKK